MIMGVGAMDAEGTVADSPADRRWLAAAANLLYEYSFDVLSGATGTRSENVVYNDILFYFDIAAVMTRKVVYIYLNIVGCKFRRGVFYTANKCQ